MRRNRSAVRCSGTARPNTACQRRRSGWWDNDDLIDDDDRDTVVSSPLRGIFAILALAHQFGNVNILPLYVVLLLITPALLVGAPQRLADAAGLRADLPGRAGVRAQHSELAARRRLCRAMRRPSIMMA
jgi:hypothetical protein